MVSPELLRRYTFFNGFSGSELKEIAMAAQEQSVKEGEVLFADGDPAEKLHFLADGEMEVLIHAEGEDIAISTLPAGEPLGWSAFIEPYIYTASCRATRPSRIISVSRTDLARRMADPHFSGLLMKRIAEVLSRRLKDTQMQLLSLTAKQA